MFSVKCENCKAIFSHKNLKMAKVYVKSHNCVGVKDEE